MRSLEEIRAILVGDSAIHEEILSRAFAVRSGANGGVYLRGLIEISSYCRRQCAYCGLRAANSSARRYRLSHEEIIAAARRVKACNIGTVVLQAGEDAALSRDFIAGVVADVGALGLVVTLSLGERPYDDLACWKDAGASRYLLRFETSNNALFKNVHPHVPGLGFDRADVLAWLKELGYEVGSGFMIGLPGQTWADLAADIIKCGTAGYDMIGIGPYVAHPATPLYGVSGAGADQVPATADMTRLVLALLATEYPDVNLPSTTALATVGGGGARAYLAGLSAGANVVMPDFTPDGVRAGYDIYPGKASFISAEALVEDLNKTLATAGRPVVPGAGHSRHYLLRTGRPQQRI